MPKQKDEGGPQEHKEDAAESAEHKHAVAPRWSWSLRKPASKVEWVFAVVGGLVAVVLLVMAVPYSRYGLLGQVFRRVVVIDVVDSRTHKPVTDAQIMLGSQTLKTDSRGEVKLAGIPVGSWQVEANKKYYNLLTTNTMVPLFGPVKTVQLSMVAIGNQVTVKVTNKITGKVMPKVKVAALGTTATTDSHGEAVLVLPVDKTKVTGTVKLSGYNDSSVSIVNTESQSAANAFSLVPNGKIYFLSKRTGTINVMKSDLDGSNASVVLAGTGHESDTDTVLVSTRDWKYLALKAQRDGDKAKLYLINTDTDKLTIIDQGEVDFVLTGWYDHDFVYRVSRPNIPYAQANTSSIKSYSADKDKLTNIASTNGDGTNYESFSEPGFLGDKIVFEVNKNYAFGNQQSLAGQQSAIRAVRTDGSGAATLKSIDAGQNYFSELKIIKPTVFEYGVYGLNGQKPTYYNQNASGSATSVDTLPGITNNATLPYYLLSPGEKQTFWYEPRDGKNTLFVGNENGGSEKELASLSEYKPYGWYSDDYLLVSKADSELYIVAADFSSPPLKITDYHKASVTFSGYGGGYGGQ